MKTISKNTVLSVAFAILAPFFRNSVVAQNTAVPPAEGSSVLFQANGPTETTEEIRLVLPGSEEVRSITVTVRNGHAFLEGDIELGPMEELRSLVEDRGVRIDGATFRWPNGVIPYTFEPGFSTAYITLINQAINYINGSTHLLLVERTTETRYIKFKPASGCSSAVGRQSAPQNVNLQDPNLNNGFGCWFKQIIHEIAHAAGLWHEQSREDRNNFVTIHWNNIESGKEHNFDQEITGATDVGTYDFASVMHYPATAFSVNGQPTITANGGQSFGNATEYSVGDVAALNSMYTTKNCPSSRGLAVEVPTVSRPMHFEASNNVSSLSLINPGSTVTFDAGSLVLLSPGFIAKEGVIFRAAIDGCGGNIQSLAGPEVDEWVEEIASHQHQESEISPHPAKTAVDIIPFAAYPNPVATNTTLQFTLPAAAIVHLGLFDLTGKSALTLVDGKDFPAGQQQVLCPMNGMAPGVYFARLNAGNGVAILKVIKVE